MTAAAHEAGHAAAALYLRGRGSVRLVTAGDHAGVTVLARHSLDFGDHDGSVLDADQSLRAAVEREVVICLAGRAAERLLAPPRSGYVAATPPPAALRRLPPRDLELLAAPPAPPADRDVDDAAALAGRLAGEEMARYLEWLAAVADAFVVRHAAAIRRLAEALAVTPVIPGPQAEAILEGGPSE